MNYNGDTNQRISNKYRAMGYGDNIIRKPIDVINFEQNELNNWHNLLADPNDFNYCQWTCDFEEALFHYAEGMLALVYEADIPADAVKLVEMPDGILWGWK